MIVLVWSLVSSVVEVARRRRLAAFLRRFFDDPANTGNVLVCKRLSNSSNRDSPDSISPSGRLSRYTSEPHLHTHRVVYRNERAEVTMESATSLHPTDWRFVPSVDGSAEERIYFIAVPVRIQEAIVDQSELPSCALVLESNCDRVAWHRLQPASLYSCSMERFVDVVFAFSEGALFENSQRVAVETIQTVGIRDSLPEAVRACSSLNGSNPQIAQRPLPLLEQLFWGDTTVLDAIKQKFTSETALDYGQFGSLPRRLNLSPRRRYRSCTYNSARTAKDLTTVSLFCDLPSQAAYFFDGTNSLPPFIRYLDQGRRLSSASTQLVDREGMSGRSEHSNGVSPSITIDELETKCDSRSDDGTMELPYMDDSDATTSPKAVMESSSYAALVTRKAIVHEEQNDVAEESNSLEVEEVLVREMTESERCPAIAIEEEEEMVVKVEEKVTSSQNTEEVEEGQKGMLIQENGSTVTGNGTINNAARPPVPPCNGANGDEHKKAPGSGQFTRKAQSSRRRHSAMIQSLAEVYSEYGGFSTRHRSLSPMPNADIFNRRSLRSQCSSGFTALSRESIRRPYTPTRKFLSAREPRSVRAMFKPPSILVYAGGQSSLYDRIREHLRKLLPNDRYTVFNISPEAIKKQPWIEPTTACLIIADTKDLDDAAWAKMQLYFNQSGKMIFVCQNRLLASLTQCDSTKKQSDILRMAFGSRDSSVTVGKDFEQFLKKSLKCLNKQGQVNEKFYSKDLAGGMTYSVVLSKTKDTPMYLYMENSAHQAAAVFSDATSDQLLAPGSKILSDSLSRVGVTISETAPANLTTGYMMAQEDTILKDLMGVRYGEEIGTSPKLFLRTSERVAEDGIPTASRDLLPVEVASRENTKNSSFHFDRYFVRLSTNTIGRVCLHVPVVTTTMDVDKSLCDAIPTCKGAVVVASQQLTGQGRGGNEFVSPVGAAMFTFSLVLPRNSSLATCPSFIQHVFAVALVDAVHELSGVEEFPLRIKWPNDFYFNRSHKVGGMIVTASSRDDGLVVHIGAGLNVSNSQPTVCLNDIVPDGVDMKFSIEEVVAESLNKFEYWLNMYEIKGQAEFLKKYYEYWLHDGEIVLLEDYGEKCVIRGLDKYGYLQVRSKKNPSKLFSVGDNGNTFDMMKGLIRHKV